MSPDDLAVPLLTVAGLPCLLFAALYLRGTAWRHMTREGRHLVAFTLALGALIVRALILRTSGPFPYHEWVATALMAVIAGLLWQRLYLLIRAQRED